MYSLAGAAWHGAKGTRAVPPIPGPARRAGAVPALRLRDGTCPSRPGPSRGTHPEEQVEGVEQAAQALHRVLPGHGEPPRDTAPSSHHILPPEAGPPAPCREGGRGAGESALPRDQRTGGGDGAAPSPDRPRSAETPGSLPSIPFTFPSPPAPPGDSEGRAVLMEVIHRGQGEAEGCPSGTAGLS